MRVFLRVVLVLGALSGAAVLWFAAMLSGGFDDLLDLRRPEASSPEVRRARAEAVVRVDRGIDRVAAEVTAATGLVPSGRVSMTGDWCEEGQHNWKIDDDYDLLCTAERTTLLVGDASVASAQLTALLGWLQSSGYQPSYEGAGLVLRAGPDAGARDPNLAAVGRYSASGGTRLQVRVVAAGAPSYRLPRSGDPFSRVVVDGVSVEQLPTTGLLAQGQYGVWLTLSQESFRD